MGLLLAAVPVGPAAAQGHAFAGFNAKDELRSAGRAVVGSKELPVVDGSAPAGSGTTYYVDSAAGSDAGNGTSAATAWKSLERVNATELQPGDRILLKAGSSWAAAGDEVAKEAFDYTTWRNGVPTDVPGPDPSALLAPKGSGTAANPIVLSSYGDGPAPQLDGRGVVNDVVQLTNQQHWDISNLEISNVTDGFDPSRFEPGANQGQRPGEENPKTGDLRGIHVEAENAGTLRGYEIHNVFIHDVSGVIWSIGNSGLDRSKRTGGILFEGLKGDARTVSQFADVVLRDNVIANTSFANVMFKQFSGMGEDRYSDRDPGWGDRAVAKASSTGVITEDPDWRPHTNVEISENYLTNRDTQYGWNSLYLTSVQRATVEGNLVDGAGVSGIEMYYADDIVVQNNEVAELETRANAADSNGIDPDRGTSNILIQGNYVHHSGEGILLCGFSFSTAVVRFNVIQDVDRNFINPHGDSGVNIIYNNLMYNTQRPISNNTVGFFESSGSAADYLVAKNPHHVLNNVFVNTRADVNGAAFRANFPGVTFAHNSYFGPNVTAPGADAQAITSDPRLGGDPGQNITNAAITSSASALIAGGTSVDLGTLAPGFDAKGTFADSQLPLDVDFFGRPLTTPPTVGPTTYDPAPGKGVIAGHVVDEYGDPVGGASVAYGTETTTADASGRYSVEVPAGDYSLVPSASGFSDGPAVAATVGDSGTSHTRLTLGPTTATTGTVAGSVTSSRTGVPDATVTLTKTGEPSVTTTTDNSGAFRFADVAEGDNYVLTVTKEGYEPTSKADVTVRAARTVAIDLVMSAVRGETDYALNETFDDKTTGPLTGTGSDGLAVVANPSIGSINVEDDPDRTGNKYLRIAKTSASSGVLAVHNAAEANLTGRVTIEARVKRTTTNGAPNQLALYSFSESGWNATNPAASTNPSATLGFSNGKIITHNVTGSSSVRNVTDYAVGQWYTIRNVVDLDTGTFDFFLDDMDEPVLVDQPLRTKVDDLDYFNFFVNGTNVGDLLVDYVRVNTGAPYDYDDATLDSVIAQAGGQPVELTSSSDGLTYSGTVPPLTETATITAVGGSPFAKITINGATVRNGDTVEIELEAGSENESEVVTVIPVVVTAEDGTRRSFTVSISRTNPSQLTDLRSLSVEGKDLSPAFSPARKGSDNPYQVVTELASSVPSVRIVWERGWANQQVRVNGAAQPTDTTAATVALQDGENVIEVTSNSFPGDLATYVVKVTRKAAEPAADKVRPVAVLVSPTSAGPFANAVLRVDATDDVGLSRIVANIYRDGTLVKSTQSPAHAAKSQTHSATVALPTGSYTVRYNAQDLAGNISRTGSFPFTIDSTAPTATVKTGTTETAGSDGVYSLISFKLFDAGKVDKITLNGVVKNLTDNTWSDLNYVRPGVFGAVKGVNKLVVHDVAGNTATHTLTLT